MPAWSQIDASHVCTRAMEIADHAGRESGEDYQGRRDTPIAVELYAAPMLPMRPFNGSIVRTRQSTPPRIEGD